MVGALTDQREALASGLRNSGWLLAEHVLRTVAGSARLVKLDVVHRVHDEISAINKDLGIQQPFPHRLYETLRRDTATIWGHLPPKFAYVLADAMRRLTDRPAR